MKIRLVFLVVILVSIQLAAQPPETNIQGTLITTGYVDDDSYGPFNIGFTFNFYGNNYTQFYVNSNGMILFGAGSSESTATSIPNASVPNNFIAPFWDDLVIDPLGKISYTTIGAAPTRKLVVQFTNVGFYTTPPAVLGTFQVILYETTNNIQIQYRTLCDNTSPRTHGGTATIGIEDATGTTGRLYSFMNPSGVNSSQAILFTPSGPNYTVDPDAVYDGLYLVSNMSMPEPGITNLVCPSQDAVIGTEQQFSWGAAAYAASYNLKISFASDLGGAMNYNTSELTKLISGLLTDTVYYWSVYSVNNTGTTWGQIYKFRTSSNPPLAATPETNWIEKNHDFTVQLDYTGGDSSPKSGFITALPPTGALYQFDNGVRGAQITSVPSAVTDTSRKVIYAAGSTTGNGKGNFKFYIHDNSGDSPESQVTINVSPAPIPSVLYVAKGTGVEIQFDIPMTDPAGKQNEFVVNVNGSGTAITSASLKTGDPYTIALTLSTPLNGTETVYVAYNAGTVTGTSGGLLASFSDILVSLKMQTITWTQSLDKKYNESPVILTGSASSGMGITFSSFNQQVATISGVTMTLRGIGTSDITVRQAGNSTWAPAKYIRTLTVNKGDQTITFAVLTARTYGDADFPPGATASSGLSVSYSSDNPAVATVVSGKIHIVGAGSVNITASQPGNLTWNAAPDLTRPLTVNKASQTITFGPLSSKTYGDAPFSISATSSSGLPVTFTSTNTAIAAVSADIVTIIGAGTDSIIAWQTGNNNYLEADSVIQLFVVNKADQTITFSLSGKTYGDTDFDPAATSSSGLAVSYSSDNSSVATIISGKIHITGAGSATITASQAGNINYNRASDSDKILTVAKAMLNFTAEDQSKEYLEVMPELTYVVTGFVNSEDASVIDVLPTIQTSAIASSAVGEYPITFSGGSDNNYEFTLNNGTLTITKITQTITFTRVPDILQVRDTFRLRAVSSSALPVSFESLDNGKATVSSDVMTGVARGLVVIRAYNDGDENFQAAEASAEVEINSTHKDVMYLFTPNGDGYNDYWELPKIQEWGRCDVKVYNRWGKLVYSNPDYDNLWNGSYDGKPLTEGAYYFLIKTENAGIIEGTVNIVR